MEKRNSTAGTHGVTGDSLPVRRSTMRDSGNNAEPEANGAKHEPLVYSRSEFLKRMFPFSIGRHRHWPEDFPTDQLHVREFYKIVYFFQGEGEYLVDGRCYPIQSGTAILAHPRFETTYRIAGVPLDLCNILFLPEFIQDNLAKLKGHADFFSIFNKSEPAMSGLYVFPCVKELEKLILRMLSEYKACEENYRVTLELLLTDLLIQLSRNAQKGMQKFKAGDIFNTLKRQIEAHCTEPFSLDEAAAEFGVSKSHLCRLFHRQSGSTIMAELNRLRLNAARRMLLDTDLPVTEICYKCGFRDLSCFFRNFRRGTGVTPLVFRKNGRD